MSGNEDKTEARHKLLVVDDDEEILKQIDWALSDTYEVFKASDRSAARTVFENEAITVVLLDLGLPPHPREAVEGLRTLEDLLRIDPLAKIIIVSGNSEREAALAAIEKGAHDIFAKPVDLDELRIVLSRVWKRVQLERESIEERNLSARISLEECVGSSSALKDVFSTVRKVAGTDVPLLITGESGTGKELVGRAVHNLSPRREGPFIAINCAAIPENLLESELFGHEKGAFTGAATRRKGKLEFADGGTLFLDEIGELAQPLQAKLLRFLQEKVVERVGGRESIPVNARVIAATNQNLDQAVEKSTFREDLFFRLAVVKVELPPLRDRGNDVIELAEHFITSFCQEFGRPVKKLSRDATDALRRHAWPGNVRELQNRIKRAVVLADGTFIGLSELDLKAEELTAPPSAAKASSLKEAREEVERELVARALEEHRGNISQAARALGISRPTLYDLLEKYGLGKS